MTRKRWSEMHDYCPPAAVGLCFVLGLEPCGACAWRLGDPPARIARPACQTGFYGTIIHIDDLSGHFFRIENDAAWHMVHELRQMLHGGLTT